MLLLCLCLYNFKCLIQDLGINITKYSKMYRYLTIAICSQTFFFSITKLMIIFYNLLKKENFKKKMKV